MAHLLFNEASFARMMSVERKRSERSGRPFLLLLLEFRTRSWGGRRQRRALVKILIQALDVCTRQTDITGWHKYDTALGVIFTELCQAEPATGTIVRKVQAALQACLTLEQTNAITVSAHMYPQQDNGAPIALANIQLYPDLKQKKAARWLKRTIDVLGSLSLLLLLSSVFVVIAVAVKLTSKGPILFKQTRIGQFGKPFTFLKFRSMYTHADPKVHEAYVKQFILLNKHDNAEAEALKQDGFFKLSRDPRVTLLGRFIRKTSLDELPQLLNILKGDMSLVGPRPPIPYETDCYDVWHRRRVLEARPGLTGLWQVNGRSRTTFDDMVRLDLRYINHWSLWADFKILLQTPWAVLRGQGAG